MIGIEITNKANSQILTLDNNMRDLLPLTDNLCSGNEFYYLTIVETMVQLATNQFCVPKVTFQRGKSQTKLANCLFNNN